MKKRGFLIAFLAFTTALVVQISKAESTDVPPAIKAIFDKPRYSKSVWGLRVIDEKTGQLLIDLSPDYDFFIGSVRKIFSVGALMNEVGAKHRSVTPIYRRGKIDKDGVLDGDLILVASGDLTMGGRTRPDGSIAVSTLDHNEANSLGNAILTAPNPLRGYISLAKQVAASGLKQIKGDVVIDDRLWVPFDFRGQFNVRPIFVNDDCVDLSINPTKTRLASVNWRPLSAALDVTSTLAMSAPRTQAAIELDPEFPQCIGTRGCTARITGQLPADFQPPFTDAFPLIRTFRIVEPANYARTVLIEALEAAGVKVDAPRVAKNPVRLLPPQNSYPASAKVASLVSASNAQHARLILKISYNIGADSSLALLGLTQGADSMPEALAVERQALTTKYGIPGHDFSFVDGSGGGLTTAKSSAVTKWLRIMTRQRDFHAFFDALPILGVDGSLAIVKDFQADPSLAGATGKVRAKTGTFADEINNRLVLRGQAFGGYIKAASGRRLIYQLVVNNLVVDDFDDIVAVFQDEGTISAILWRDF